MHQDIFQHIHVNAADFALLNVGNGVLHFSICTFYSFSFK